MVISQYQIKGHEPLISKEKKMKMTPKAIANEFDTTPKAVRKFLRSITDDRPGKGGKWEVEVDDIDALRERFEASTNRTTVTIDLTE